MARAVTHCGEMILRDLLRQKIEISSGSLAMLDRKAGYSITKAKNMLGYSPRIDLSSGMKLTEDWLKQQWLI